MAGTHYVGNTLLNLGDDSNKYERIQKDSNKKFKTVHACNMSYLKEHRA